MALTRREQRELNRDLKRQQEQAARRGVRSGIARVLARIARRILRLEVSETADALERGEDGVAFAEEARLRWSERWRISLEAPLEEAAIEAGERVAEAVGGESLPPSLERALSEHVSRLSETLSETSYNNVRDVIREAQSSGLSVPQTAARLREQEPEMSKYRSELISRTELLQTSRLGAYIQAQESELVAGQFWRTAQDSRVRESHRAMEGEYTELGQPFSSGQTIVVFGDPNCRCHA